MKSAKMLLQNQWLDVILYIIIISLVDNTRIMIIVSTLYIAFTIYNLRQGSVGRPSFSTFEANTEARLRALCFQQGITFEDIETAFDDFQKEKFRINHQS